MSGEKTEKPTAQRKKEARRDGQIPRTPDLGAWGGLLVASTLLPMVARNAMQTAEGLLVQATRLIAKPDPAMAMKLFATGLGDAALTVAPLACAMMLAGVAASAAQGGLRPSMKLLQPKMSRLNPLSGIKRAFGVQAMWEATKVLLKTAVLTGVLYMSTRDLLPALLSAGTMPLSILLETIIDSVLNLIRMVAGVGLVLAGADYAVALRRVNKQVKMSKQDIKDENKRSEGDPQLKGQIRAKQMAMSRQRMMTDLASADVVLVNPTHVAVALRYDPARGAPRVVAKGAGVVATKIREMATEKRIPMVQDVPLARTLYQACDLGQEIPPQFYGAIARVLAFVMTLKAKGSAAGVHRNVFATAA